MSSSARLLHGDSRTVLATLPDGIARCCVTSPPYWGLRDYGTPGQLGLEPTPEAYVANMVAVFREVRRVLADDGTLWLNLGDTYAAQRGGTTPPAQTVAGGVNGQGDTAARRGQAEGYNHSRNASAYGLKPKDLVGIPWLVAFALRADGWYLRSDIIWSKPNPMPESVRDRPTKAHEYVFLLSKRERYYYDASAIAEPASLYEPQERGQGQWGNAPIGIPGEHASRGRTSGPVGNGSATRNARSVWSIATQPYKDAHFATFPEELARRCILAGSAPGDTVLDPFGGSGTVASVATGHGRGAIHIDLNPEYLEMAKRRIGELLVEVAP